MALQLNILIFVIYKFHCIIEQRLWSNLYICSKHTIILSFIFKIAVVLLVDCSRKTSIEGLINFVMYCDCRISVFESKVFLFNAGKLKPAGALITGKLKISGNMRTVMKLDKLMTKLKSKL